MSNKRMSKKKLVTAKRRQRDYVEIYSKSDYDRDEKNFSQSIDGEKPIDWSSFKNLMIHDLCTNNILETKSLGAYSLKDINFALEHPSVAHKKLVDASDYLMRVSPHYNKLNNYYSNMVVFYWGIDLYDVKDNYNTTTLKKLYTSLAGKLEHMNIKHEFSKIAKVLPSQDVFYGVTVEGATDFFIQQLDHQICKLSQIQDGLYNFKIDLSSIKPTNLNAYPNYIKQAYIDFTDPNKKNNTNRWYSPPADKQICIKFNQHLTYPYPLLINLVRDILDLDVYKKLKLQSARTDNYKAIMIQIPNDDKTVDKLMITDKILSVFAQINKENMSDDIGLIHTPGKGEPISFKDSNNTRNNVEEATDDIYNSSGVTKELFNGSASGTAVTFSIENDSGFTYGLYRQFERWVNRYIKINKYNKSTFKFFFYLIDATIFNKDAAIARYKDACTLGAPVVDKWLAALGLTPSRIMGSFILQKDIFNFSNNLVPLATSYTQPSGTPSSDGGRPTNASNGDTLTESGEQTQTNDSNSKR